MGSNVSFSFILNFSYKISNEFVGWEVRVSNSISHKKSR